MSTCDTEENLTDAINKLNLDDDVDGILVQLPLPRHINEEKIISLVNPEKDVDGFHPLNAGKLMQGLPTFIPATPFGIMLLLEHYGIETSGKHAVVIGRSNIVGRPISILLNQNSNPGNCTVTICHSRTKGLKEICLQGDIIVAALGKPGFLTADMGKENAVVIDVGITRVADTGKKSGFAIKGDVDFGQVAPKFSYISVLTLTPSQICSPTPMQSPLVVICVVPVSLLSDVAPVEPVVVPPPDELSEVEVDVLSEVAVAVVSVDVGVDDADIPDVTVVDMSFVLEFESVPVIDALVASLIDAAVVSSSGSPPQATRVRPSSAETTTGADPWTERIAAEQNGQRRSLSQT